jgi:hypothetical protein
MIHVKRFLFGLLPTSLVILLLSATFIEKGHPLFYFVGYLAIGVLTVALIIFTYVMGTLILKDLVEK